jgi:hypothetical protein
VRIVLEFCRIHNCSVIPVTDDFKWGYIYDNGTGDGKFTPVIPHDNILYALIIYLVVAGVMGQVYLGKAEFGCSGLYLWYREYAFIEYSSSYLYSCVVCLVPRPGALPPWLGPVLPFPLDLWLSLLAALVVSTLALYSATLASTALFSKHFFI